MDVRISALLLMTLAACNRDSAGEFEPPSVDSPEPALATTPPSVVAPSGPREIEASVFAADQLPPGFDASGAIRDGLRWRDAAGDNWVLLSRAQDERDGRRSLRLRLQHLVVGDGGQPRSLADVEAAEDDCDFDLLGGFVREALGVSDLDADGIGEATVAYELACTSDLSPLSLTLLVFEGGAVYAVHGTTEVRLGGERYGGERRPDDGFAAAPLPIQAHADRIWSRIVTSMPGSR